MTRAEDAAKTLTDWADSEGGLEAIARNYDGDLSGAVEALDADGHLLPDLPEPDNDYPEWCVGTMLISSGIGPGEVLIEWEDREDTGDRPETISQALTPDQVRAIIAAHVHRE